MRITRIPSTLLILALSFITISPSFGHFSNIPIWTSYQSSYSENPLLVISLKSNKITPEQIATIDTNKFEVLESSETTIKVLVLKGQDYLSEIDTELIKNIQVINNPESIQKLIGKPATRVIHVEFKDASSFWKEVKSEN